MLSFYIHSLFREYGWQFVRHVVLPHPLRFAKALLSPKNAAKPLDRSRETHGHHHADGKFIVGVGFCMKPLDPPCISGRFNHDCHCLEHFADLPSQEIPKCCQACAIREIGIQALKAGAAFYIMTSAHDILFDLFKPALDEQRFTLGLFIICRYSFEPFDIGLRASGIKGYLMPFEEGDCTDYRTWLRADRGTKDERTSIGEDTHTKMLGYLDRFESISDLNRKYVRRCNVFFIPKESLQNDRYQ